MSVLSGYGPNLLFYYTTFSDKFQHITLRLSLEIFIIMMYNELL